MGVSFDALTNLASKLIADAQTWREMDIVTAITALVSIFISSGRTNKSKISDGAVGIYRNPKF